MTKYETLIFDLDDTLIDNKESIKYAFNIILNYLKIDFDLKLFKKWAQFDTNYWHEFESGKMLIPDNIHSLKEKINYLRATRFLLFFNYFNLNFDEALTLNQLYCDNLSENIVAIKDAKKILNLLKNNYELIVATNGPREAALKKLVKANLNDYISKTISADEIGLSKPNKEFFDYLCSKTKNTVREKMLIIGDSLSTDILGGMNSNIDTCWFNPHNYSLNKKYTPTMTINKLIKLKNKL